MQAALHRADAGPLLQQTLSKPDLVAIVESAMAIDVVAAGKAAGAMLTSFERVCPRRMRHVVGIGGRRPELLSARSRWLEAGHPVPDDRSLAAGESVLAMARSASPRDVLILLLSGGASSLMAVPAAGISLAAKQQTISTLLNEGADIEELNVVRKHLSAIKGGQLALVAGGAVLTLALSDVPGDDPSTIASGPTVADATTAAAALAILARRGGQSRFPGEVLGRLRRMAAGEIPETPKPGDPRLSRSVVSVIGGPTEALDGAQEAAETLGYQVSRISGGICGEARTAAAQYSHRVVQAMQSQPRPICVLSAGETTVRVTGSGKGGRNQEFALAFATHIPELGAAMAATSLGTDGVDGPTDAAGAIVDETTIARGAAHGLDAPQRYLDDNNSYAFFNALGDLIRTGPTNTNVADIQITLIA